MELKFSPPNLSMQDQSRPDQNLESFQSLRAERLARSESKETDLVLRTKEGDVVTLSKSSDFESELNTYSAINKNGSRVAREQGFSQTMEFTSAYEISVEGDLSKEELRDINKAIRKLDKAMNHLANGDTGKALQKAMSLTRLDSVAGFEANLSYQSTKEYQYVQQSVYEKIAQAPMEPPKINDEARSLLEKLSDELAETIKESEVTKEKVMPSVNQMFEDMKERMEEFHPKREETPWDDFLGKLQDRFNENLFQKKDDSVEDSLMDG